jgi:hypothetical protein
LKHWEKYPPAHITLAITNPTKPKTGEAPQMQGLSETSEVEKAMARRTGKKLSKMPAHIQEFIRNLKR